MNTEKLEGIILSEIIESSKQSNKLSKKYLTPTKQLFESVFDKNKYLPKNTLQNCRYNKYFYFNQVLNTVKDYSNDLQQNNLVILNESIQNFNTASNEFVVTIDNFLNDIQLEINELKYQDDFLKLDNYSDTIKKTLLFKKSNINVMGFNLFNFLNNNSVVYNELLEKFNANILSDLKMLLFNKIEKELYFIFEKNSYEKTVIFYNIKNNTLDYFFNKNLLSEFGISNTDFQEIIWSNEKNILLNFVRYISGSTIELYRDFNKFNIKFEDNIYKDITWNNYLNQIRKDSIIKK